MSDAREEALDVAVDALTRRARILDPMDPGIAKELRTIAARLEKLTDEDWRRSDRTEKGARLKRGIVPHGNAAGMPKWRNGMRICTTCLRYLQPSEFHRDARSEDGLTFQCWKCRGCKTRRASRVAQ